MLNVSSRVRPVLPAACFGCVSMSVARSCKPSLFLKVKSALGCRPNTSGPSTPGKLWMYVM